MKYVNVNGKLVEREQAGVPMDNGAFRHGYGVFETVLIVGGQLQLWKYHWDRLSSSMADLGLQLNKLYNSSGYLEQEIIRSVTKNGLLNLCRVRLAVYGGEGGLMSGGIQQAGFVIECFEIASTLPEWNENGLVLTIYEDIKKVPDKFAYIKSSNGLQYVMAAQYARQQKCNDALVQNIYGHITESAIANIFVVKNSIISTPPISEGCVAGVMRSFLLDKVPGIVEQPISMDELMQADEVFLTNAIRRIKWVRCIGDKIFTSFSQAYGLTRIFEQ